MIDSTIGLGDDYMPDVSQWLPISYQDSLRSVINEKRLAGDFDKVPMSWSTQETYQTKLSWRATPKIKIGYNRMFSNTVSQSYSHGYRWNPDGRPYSFNTRLGDILRADISINRSTFANFMF